MLNGGVLGHKVIFTTILTLTWLYSETLLPLPLQGFVVTSAICQQITLRLLGIGRKKSSASVYDRGMGGSQLILQPFCRFTYITAHSPTLPLLHLRHSSFSNPSFASPTSQALHLIHLASLPWYRKEEKKCISLC